MGRYYALHDGEPEEVAEAIAAHYRPRFAGDELPQESTAIAVALADKLDALAGLFGIGQIPTGDRDPFGLRRAALGVIRILIERDLPLSLHDLVNEAFAGYDGQDRRRPCGSAGVHPRPAERLPEGARLFGARSRLGDQPAIPARSTCVPRATGSGAGLQQAARSAEPRRRQQARREHTQAGRDQGRVLRERRRRTSCREPAERALFEALAERRRSRPRRLFDQGDFTGYLKSFAVLKTPVDAFFDSVMVMVEDPDAAAEPPRVARRPAQRDEPRGRHLQARRLRSVTSDGERVMGKNKLLMPHPPVTHHRSPVTRMKLVILDRDGVINHDSASYISSPDEWQPLPGSLEAIAKLTQAGYHVVVATNQSAIGRGLLEMATLNAIHDKMHRAVAQAGGRIDAVFYCPHGQDDELRLPQAEAGPARGDRPALQHRSEGRPVHRRRAARPAGGRSRRRAAGPGADRQGREDAAERRAAGGNEDIRRSRRRGEVHH